MNDNQRRVRRQPSQRADVSLALGTVCPPRTHLRFGGQTDLVSPVGGARTIRSVTEFAIAMPDEVLADLRERLGQARLPAPTNQGWVAGTDPAYLRDLVDYWRHDFGWRAEMSDAKGVAAADYGPLGSFGAG